MHPNENVLKRQRLLLVSCRDVEAEFIFPSMSIFAMISKNRGKLCTNVKIKT